MEAVAVFADGPVQGEAVAKAAGRDTILTVCFKKLPSGDHGFHIHRAGDLRGEGCKGACDHWHKGRPCAHGPGPGPSTKMGKSRFFTNRKQRHTGDLGNVNIRRRNRTYTLKNVRPSELFGRTLIVHADPDDLGLGPHEDSKVTGHSGKRIACAVWGRGN